MPSIQNRHIILLLGCLTVFFPGTFVFGFPGVMASFWQDTFQVGKEDIGKIMFFILAGTGFSMYLAGKLQEKIPSHILILTGTAACASAMLLAGFADSMSAIYAWAFMEGFFTGFIYIPCLTIFQKMFPDAKGLTTGIINLTFGGASAVMSPLLAYLLVSKGYLAVCWICFFLSIVTGGAASLFIRLPEGTPVQEKQAACILPLGKVLRTGSFWRIWGVWAFAGASGVSLIVLSSSFGIYSGYDITKYVYILTCFNILNGMGRIACGKLSDHFSKQKILMAVFFLAASAYLLMPWVKNIYMVSFLACFVGLAFGGMFTVSAPLVTEVFGLENFGRIFGMVFTAYGFFAGLLGPWLSGILLDMTDLNFKIVFSMFALFYLFSIFLISGVKKVSLHDRA